MTIVPLALTFALLLFWLIVGWSLIAITLPRLGALQSFLLAPVVGVAVTLLPTFWLSVAGFPVETFARPLSAILLVAALGLWIWRRPTWSRQELIFALPIVAAIVLIGFPSFRFGLDWLANANDDWANYNLSAIRLLHAGFYEQPSIDALKSGQDYPGYLWFLVVAGNGRPGADLLLALVAGVTAKNPFFVFMPVILAFHGALCGAAAAVALPVFARRRYLFAGLCLTAMAPLSLYAVHQQLIAQVVGLAFMCAIASLSFVSFTELRSTGRILLSSTVAAAYWLLYPETVPFFVLTFLLFHIAHIRRPDWGWRSSWIVLLLAAITAVLVAPYLVSFFLYLLSQLQGSGTQGVYKGVSIFPYFLVPSGLSVLFGLLPLGGSMREPFLSLSIAASVALVLVILTGMIAGMRRRLSIAAFLWVICLVTVVIISQRNDFGTFKIAMFAQNFVWFVVIFAALHLKKRGVIYLVCIVPIWMLLTDISYVSSAWMERAGGGNAIPYGSGDRILSQLLDDQTAATCNVTYETPLPPMMKILGARQGCGRAFDARPSFFNGTFGSVLEKSGKDPLHKILGITQFTSRAFEALDPKTTQLPFPTAAVDGSPVRINQLTKEYAKTIAGGPEVGIWSDRDANGRNQLTLIDSNLGSYYYLPETGIVSIYASERDIYFTGRMFAAAGRYLLFQVNDPSSSVRLHLDMTSSIVAGSERNLPPAKVVGEASRTIGLSGYGAGRVVSEPVVPLTFEGKSYILLDMASDAVPLRVPRRGLMKLYGQNVALDYRQMTGFVRRIRLIDAQAKLPSAPSSLQKFPADLANDALQFSGMYEDGWLGDQGFFVLSSEKTGFAVMRGLFQSVGLDKVDLTLSIDGGDAVTKHLEPGAFQLALPVKAGTSRIQFKFSNIGRLPRGDERPAVALLTSLAIDDGVAVGKQQTSSAFASAGNAIIDADGIFTDGWQAPASTLLMQSPGIGKVILSGMMPGNLGLEGQEVEIKGGSEGIVHQLLQAGNFEIQVPVSEGTTKLEVSFTKSNKLPNGDGRRVSVLLQSVKIVP